MASADRSSAIAIVVALLVLGGAILAWFSLGTVTLTDGRLVSASPGDAPLRSILWEPPRKLEQWGAGPPDGADDTEEQYEPRVSFDGSTLFFVRRRAGQNADIYIARRTPLGWTEPQPLADINSSADDLGPEPSADGATLIFSSNREDPSAQGSFDLWISKFENERWTSPRNLGPSINSPWNEHDPALSPEGDVLVFSSNRPRPGEVRAPTGGDWPATIRQDQRAHDYDLYSAALAATDRWANSTPLERLNTQWNEGAASYSPRGEFLYFASDRPGGAGGFDLYRVRQTTPQLLRAWPVESLGAPVNTPANELDPTLTAEGYTLQFSSDRDTAAGIDRRYDLFETHSREVFRDVALAKFDWAGWWQTIAPWLAWLLALLLLLVLLLLLLRLIRDPRWKARWRQLGLLARCLILSALAHALLLALLTLWQVTSSITSLLDGSGPSKIALIAGASDDGIESQLFAPLEPPTTSTALMSESQLELAALPPAPPLERVELPIEHIAAAPERTRVDIELASAQPPELASPSPTPPSAPQRLAQANPVVELPAAAAAHPPVAEETLTLSSQSAPTTLAPVELPPSVLSAIEPTVLAPVKIEHAPAPLSAALPTLSATPQQPMSVRSAADAFRPPARPSVAELALPDAPTPLANAAPDHSDASELLPVSQAVDAPLAVHTPSAPRVSEFALAPARVAHPETTPRVTVNQPSLSHASLPTTVARVDAPAAPNAPALAQLSLTLPEASVAARATEREEPRALPASPGAMTASPRAPLATLSAAAPSLTELAPLRVESLAAAAPSRTEPTLRLRAPALSIPESLTLSAPPRAELHLTPQLSLPEEPAPELYAQRAPEKRQTLVEKGGGSKETEAAVANALAWLARAQRPDGGWNGQKFAHACADCDGVASYEFESALTGLSLLCFLGADHTHIRDGPYRDTVTRGLEFLLERQSATGDLRAGESLYSHGMASIALAEAYGMTRDQSLAEPVRRAVEFISTARSRRHGGWRYEPNQAGDTSVLGWQVMALESARRCDIAVPREAIDEARSWLSRVTTDRTPGLYSYQPFGPPTESMTAEALFVRHLVEENPRDPNADASVSHILRHLPNWRRSGATYYWYYATLALYQRQGPEWGEWNRALMPVLLESQRKDNDAAGSWNPSDRWSEIGGRIYQTAICTLTLEVYYRYLPSYLRAEANEAAPP